MWENVTDEKLVCDEHYGTFKVGIIEFGCFAFFSEKTQLLSQVEAARADRFTGAECMCDLNSRGNGFDCCERRFLGEVRILLSQTECARPRSPRQPAAARRPSTTAPSSLTASRRELLFRISFSRLNE